MQDLRPSPQQPQRNARVEVEPHPPRARSGRLVRELPSELLRARLALVQHEHPRVQAALAKQRQQRQQVRLRARDARDLLDVQDPGHADRREHASAQCSTECSRRTRSRSSSPIARRRSGPGREPAHAVRRPGSAGSSCAKRKRRLDPADERVEPGARDERRQRRRGGLVHDLVERAGPHVVDEHVDARVDLRDCSTRNRPLDVTRSPSREQRRAARATAAPRPPPASATGRAARATRRVREQPLRPRRSSRGPSPATCGRARAARRTPSSARAAGTKESTSIPCPTATTLASRAGSSSDRRSAPSSTGARQARSRRERRQCVNQRRTGTPSGRASGAPSTA